jgi:MFS family permease
VVAFCFLAAVFTRGLAVFGASVYLHEITKARGWSVSLVSAGITVFYLTAALVLPAVGAAIDRRGPRPVIAGGAVLLALGVAAVGHVAAPWQLRAAFVRRGLGHATMSGIGLSATIAPWFEKYQGRAVAMALTGASVGAMVVVPLVALSIARHGFSATTAAAAAIAAITLVPLALVVLRYRGPAELGLGRDIYTLGDDPDHRCDAYRSRREWLVPQARTRVGHRHVQGHVGQERGHGDRRDPSELT